MIIHLLGPREQIILSLMEAGKFSSVDEVIDEALRLVEKRYQQADERTGHSLRISGDQAGSWMPCRWRRSPMG
jgi:Arc/MetJ-type ribon-helix-helix transcriptional regulator